MTDKFARTVFTGAGIWGVVVLAPLFFLHDIAGRAYAAPTEYPHFFYGFLLVAMLWQFVFFLVGSNPVRYRPLMFLSIIEKLGFVATVALLYANGRLLPMFVEAAIPDGMLGILFVVAFIRPPRRSAADQLG